jgi:putative membrane protein insertion efficiency factor
MKHVCIALIRFYQKHLSPLKRNPTCKFTPTCSAYAIEAFSKRGFFVGFGLTVWRILRCNPWSIGGYDPVPEKRSHRRVIREGKSLAHSDESEDGSDAE